MASPLEADPELDALPPPRRPWRRVTLGALAATTLASLLTLIALGSDLAYALRRGSPAALGDASTLRLSAARENTWVQLRGQVALPRIGYRRPLERDGFRVAPLEGHGRSLWVSMRLPHELDADRFVPPDSFVGRLVPLHRAGFHHASVLVAIQRATGGTPPEDAWLLIDGEAPSTSRWLLGAAVMLVGFAGFGAWGLSRLTRRLDASAADGSTDAL